LSTENLGRREYISEFDGLRALAVILVFLNHFAPQTISQFDFLRRVGWVGVDLFFVLSGFLITGILLDSRCKPGYYRRFYWRRSLRIFPLYYALLTFMFIKMAVVTGGHEFSAMVSEWGSPLWLYAYLGNVKTALTNISPPSYFTPMWSLHVEEQYYLIFPFLVYRVSERNLRRTLIAVVIAAPLLRLALWRFDPTKPLLQYMLLPCRMDGLGFGALIALQYRSLTQGARGVMLRRRPLALSGFVLLALACIVFQVGGGEFNTALERTIGYTLFAAAFACFVLWIVLYRGDRSTAWLNSPPLQFLGRISYGIYLLQLPAAWLVHLMILPSSQETIPHSIVVWGSCVALATVSWYLMEQPILELKERFVS
jgi:peptidoglycan/LPS O-acetylase OafA/YrhL